MLGFLNRSDSQRGDTIVEVLIVLAILGFAIGIAYSTANASLLDTRQAQENSQAAERIAAQLEALRVMASNPASFGNNYIFGYGAATFCIINDGTNSNAESVATAAGGCQYDGLYNISITGPPSSLGGLLTVTATWPDVEGQGNDTVTLSYRLYPTLP